MSNFEVHPTHDESALKKIEKGIIKEGKTEDATVSHALKDLSKLEKASSKATKAVDKSQHALDKSHRREHSATKALNKAAHKHDLAVADIANAEKDLEARKAEAQRLELELAKRKEDVNGVLDNQRKHNSIRESKLAEVHHARAGTTNSTATNTSVSPTNVTGTDTVASPVSHSGTDDAGIAGVGAGTQPAKA
jgi:phage-related minor tail protein